jgi:hypothetical protein
MFGWFFLCMYALAFGAKVRIFLKVGVPAKNVVCQEGLSKPKEPKRLKIDQVIEVGCHNRN